MDRSRFLMFLSIIVVSFLFIKIYQHNLVVRLMYETQSVARNKETLRKKKDKLLVQIFTLKNPRIVRKKAVELLGMRDLKVSQIVTCT